MIVRFYDRSNDKPEDLARLNPWAPNVQAWLARHYAFPFPEKNLIVAEEDGKLVGCLHIYDGGFPFAFLDNWWLDPEYRTLPNALKMGRFAEEELKARGIPMFSVYAEESLVKGLVWGGMKCRTEKPTFHLLTKVFED